jgi:DNA-binding transcriptional LysR family regulator
MNLRFVEAFYWAVTLSSVTRAADKLFVTQSALSSRIAALEEELGVLLLDRRDKQFRLTMAGARFHRHAEKLLNLQRDIRAEFGTASGASERHALLRVGVIESVLHSWLVEWVQLLRREQPALQLDLTVETSAVLLDQMRRGALDLTVAVLPLQGEGIDNRALAPMPMVFVGPRPAPRRGQATLASVAGAHELLTFQRASQPYVALLEACRGAGIDSPRVHAISSISAMLELAEQGFGVATLPAAAVRRLASQRPLAVWPVDVQLPPLPVHLSWRDDPSSPIVGRAVESLRAFTNRWAQAQAAGGVRGASSKKSMTR